MKTTSLYRKNSKGRYESVAEMELYSNKYYHHGIYLTFSRPGILSTIRLNDSEEDMQNLLHLCIQKFSVDKLSKLISEAHDKVVKKDADGQMSYLPADWYEEIAKMLLERAEKTKGECYRNCKICSYRYEEDCLNKEYRAEFFSF